MLRVEFPDPRNEHGVGLEVDAIDVNTGKVVGKGIMNFIENLLNGETHILIAISLQEEEANHES